MVAGEKAALKKLPAFCSKNRLDLLLVNIHYVKKYVKKLSNESLPVFRCYFPDSKVLVMPKAVRRE